MSYTIVFKWQHAFICSNDHSSFFKNGCETSQARPVVVNGSQGCRSFGKREDCILFQKKIKYLGRLNIIKTFWSCFLHLWRYMRLVTTNCKIRIQNFILIVQIDPIIALSFARVVVQKINKLQAYQRATPGPQHARIFRQLSSTGQAGFAVDSHANYSRRELQADYWWFLLPSWFLAIMGGEGREKSADWYMTFFSMPHNERMTLCTRMLRCRASKSGHHTTVLKIPD